MAVSIARVPPAGSRLKRYVDFLGRISNAPDPQPLSVTSQAVADHLLMRNERRIWKLPRRLVRDNMVRDALAALYGPDEAADLFARFPGFVDEYTDLMMAQAHRDATPEERRPPDQSPHAIVHGIVMATFLDVTQDKPGLTRNAYHVETARRLGPGVDRHAVRRMVRRMSVGLRTEIVGTDMARAHLAAIELMRDLMRKCDEQHRRSVCSVSAMRKPGRNAQRPSA